MLSMCLSLCALPCWASLGVCPVVVTAGGALQGLTHTLCWQQAPSRLPCIVMTFAPPFYLQLVCREAKEQVQLLFEAALLAGGQPQQSWWLIGVSVDCRLMCEPTLVAVFACCAAQAVACSPGLRSAHDHSR